MYGILITSYLFIGGAASGSLLVMCAWSLLFHLHASNRAPRIRRAFRSLKSTVYTVSFILLVLSVVCLTFDLASPQKAYLIFIRPHATPITFGAFALAIGLVIGFFLMVANVMRPRWTNGYVKGAFEIMGVACSICIMAYTGVLLYSQESVPMWHSPWIVPLFMLSSVSCGISVVLLIDYFIQGKLLLLSTVKPLQKMHLICLVCETIALGAFAFDLFTNPQAADSAKLLLETDMRNIAAIGIIGMGIAAPAAMESYALACENSRSIPVSDVICLIGGFCLRFCMVMCGTH